MKRIGSILMTLVLLLCAVLTVLPAPALADDTTPEITLDAGVIAKNDTVWFGSYASTNYNHSGPVQWRVLSPKGDGTLPVSGTKDVLLISNHLLEDGDVYFKQDGASNQWAGSDARKWCEDLFANWPEKERAAVKETTVTETGDYRGGHFNDYYGPASLNKEHFFFLSAQEADTYFTGDDDRQGYSEYRNRSWYWWLRSPLSLDDVLSGYMAAHSDYYARMIAAYPIGYSITQDDLDRCPWLRFAEGADDTGVIVSWNTEGPGNGESRLVLDGAISINPINWRRDDAYAPASENLGSLVDGELVSPGVADAQVDVNRGVVVCTNEDFPYLDTSALASVPVFGTKSFHGNDYTFYYVNIQKNVADRIAAYWAKAAASAPSAEAVIDDFISNFEALAAIPRQSKHEKAVSDYLKGWAEEQGYTVRQNEANDLFFDVPAAEGYEALPLAALQAHLDMVCVAEEGRAFDPLTDPIRVIVDREAGTMTADGTTLGADDGAGVAMMMSIVKGYMAHGPLRVIFTTDEEIDMTGALAVTPEDLAGVRYLINVDSEWSDTVTVSSAADARIVTADTPRLADARGDTAVSLMLFGLAGGHSGVMIGEGRCNAITALAETLTELGDVLPFELVSLTGGIAENAIPTKAQAVIMIDAADREALTQFIAEKQAALRETYAGIEDGLSLVAEDADAAGKVLEGEQAERVLAYVTGAIDGVYTMSEVIDGLVESSSNMGVISVNADGIEIWQMPRSSSAERLADIEDHHRALAAENGLAIDITSGSRPWPAKADSVLVPMIQSIYREISGEEIMVEAVHAGLECGAFSELAEGLDMVSIGPDVANAHSPEETLYLNSITKTWRLLEQLLTSLP